MLPLFNRALIGQADATSTPSVCCGTAGTPTNATMADVWGVIASGLADHDCRVLLREEVI
jgi:hypothetical protein